MIRIYDCYQKARVDEPTLKRWSMGCLAASASHDLARFVKGGNEISPVLLSWSNEIPTLDWPAISHSSPTAQHERESRASQLVKLNSDIELYRHCTGQQSATALPLHSMEQNAPFNQCALHPALVNLPVLHIGSPIKPVLEWNAYRENAPSRLSPSTPDGNTGQQLFCS